VPIAVPFVIPPTATFITVSTLAPSITPEADALANQPAGGLGITRAEAESILSDSGMTIRPDSDVRGLKRTRGDTPRSLTSVELIGPDDGIVYIGFTFDFESLDELGPSIGDRWGEPIADAIGDPELIAWCRFRIMDARSALERGENLQTKGEVNGRPVSFLAIPATPGGLINFSIGALPE
jgi:hypothetical protein